MFRMRSGARGAVWSAVVLAGVLSCTPSRHLGNTFRMALAANLKSLDPAQASDSYSNQCQFQVYECLFEYQYLARPYALQPCLAAAMPTVDSGDTVYTIRFRSDIRFQDDPCFPGGKGRRVTAHDFIYSIKRLVDVRTQTFGWWIFDGKVKGLDAFRRASGRLPPLPDSLDPALYRQVIPGLRALNDTTLRIELTRPCPYFQYILAMPYCAVVAREAVEYYGPEFLNHPVGTGPYRLQEWRHGLRLVFVRNPNYHHGFYPTVGTAADSAAGLLADAGRPLPFIDRVEFYIYNEAQPMWLNFLRGNLDRSAIPKDNYGQAMTPDRHVRGALAAQGIRVQRMPELDVAYICLNMQDTVLGRHRKLRQAMQLAYDAKTFIDRFANGRGIPAQSLLPPGMFGYDSAFHSPYAHFDLAAAKARLAAAGFAQGHGLPTFSYLTLASTDARQAGEYFAQEMAALGIKVKVESCTWPEYLERLRQRKFQLVGAAWMADYPDPENFLQLLYGPNHPPGENNASYENPEYDSLYRRVAEMSDSPLRFQLIQRMKAIVAEDCPWIFISHRISEYLSYDWVHNYQPHAVIEAPVKYLRLDPTLRRSRLESR